MYPNEHSIAISIILYKVYYSLVHFLKRQIIQSQQTKMKFFVGFIVAFALIVASCRVIYGYSDNDAWYHYKVLLIFL